VVVVNLGVALLALGQPVGWWLAGLGLAAFLPLAAAALAWRVADGAGWHSPAG
jgi:hypothetical protein